MVGILLNPGRSAIWHEFRAPKHRSRTERVLSIVLPRGPSALPNSKPPSWIVTAVWAPVPTSTSDELDGFWDEVTHETAATEVSFSPPCTLTHALGTHTPHILQKIGTHSLLKIRMNQVKYWEDIIPLPCITLMSIQLVRSCPLATGCMPTPTCPGEQTPRHLVFSDSPQVLWDWLGAPSP